MKRLPKSPAELRASKAARQARWRANAKAKAQITSAVNASLGRSEGSTALPADISRADLAAYLRERALKAISEMSDDELTSKDMQPFIANALRSEGQIEARTKAKPVGSGTVVLAWLAQIDKPLGLPDPNVIEGEAIELEEAD